MGSAFLYAAIVKIGSPQDFADSIAAYRILPDSAINLAALGLPLFELMCGFLVLTGFYLRIAVLGIATLLVLFMGALAAAWVRGLSVDCGCFGAHSFLDGNPRLAIVRDALLLTAAIFIYRQRLDRIQATVQATANK